MSRTTKWLIICVSVAVLSAALIGLTLRRHGQRPAVREQSQLKLLKDVIGIVRKSYVEEVDTKKLLTGAVEGMLATLDPHSAFMTPEPYREMQISMSGSFGGLGIEINIRDEKLTVISPIEDTPAFRAGIKANDYIWKIGDKLTKGMTITQAVNLMRGPKGTRVTLTILREGQKTPLVFHLVRDTINTKSLKARTLEPGYGYIRIIQFQERTGQDFQKTLQLLRQENNGTLKGLILDLRNNPGGLVDTATQVVDPFIGEGTSDGTIVSMRGRTPDAQRNYYAHFGPKEPHYPIVVLINGASASASEIIAGALQDQKRAIIMGTQSYGKGSVQSVITLRDGYGLKLTTARYYTPSGRSIQAKGIRPDIIVAQSDVANKTNGSAPSPHTATFGNRSSMPAAVKPSHRTSPPVAAEGDLANDFQLSRALETLKGLNIFAGLASKPATVTGGGK